MESSVLVEAMTQGSFADFALHPEVKRALETLGYAHPTEIQMQTIPLALRGEDFIGQAKTGTGKTAAFGLPMLTRLQPGHLGLVLVPTRELALQVQTELDKFSKFLNRKVIAVYGGQSINIQIDAIRHGADIIVATPGRLLDHLERRTVNLQKVQILVLDEADRMLDMGFRDDIAAILKQMPRERQTMLFSATISDEVIGIAQNYMNSTQRIGKSDEVVVERINQEFYLIERNRKISLLVDVLRRDGAGKTIIFCRTRRQVDFLTEKLAGNRFHCEAIHAGLRQARRDKVMDGFRANKIQILVATDVAARGLDIPDVTHVVNYDLPQSSDDYVHRIGRTARAGKSGKAISLVTEQEAPTLLDIEKAIGLKIPQRYLERFSRIPLESLDIERLRQELWLRESKFQRRGGFKKREEPFTNSGPVPVYIMD